MSNPDWTPPRIVHLDVFAELPSDLFRTGETSWGERRWNRPSMPCFLEGPTLQGDGSLLVVDVAWGRILRVSPQGEFSEVVSYNGQPNGLAIDHDGALWIADASEGLLRMRTPIAENRPEPSVTEVAGERLLGLNDLVVDSEGDVLVTDQGDTGLHDPSGRVLRITTGGEVQVLLDNVPSPNGIALDRSGALLVAATRDNAIWRGVFDGRDHLTRVGRFVQLSGGIGPDGIAMTNDGILLVAHLGTGRLVVFDRWGMELGWYQSHEGRLVSNVCVDESAGRVYVTESETHSILVADLDPFHGRY